MRALDGDAVRQAIDRATGNDKAAVAALHKSERLRDALIADDAALTKLIAQSLTSMFRKFVSLSAMLVKKPKATSLRNPPAHSTN